MRARPFSLLLLVSALLAAGCDSGGSTNGPLPAVASAKATRDVVDGAAKLSTTIVVDFDRPFDLAPGKVPLASQFEFEVADPRKGPDATKRVLVAKADNKSGSRTITLTVDALIPDGAKLKVANKTFRQGDTGQTVVPVQSDLSLAAVILATLPLTSESASFVFDPGVIPVKPADRDPVAQKNALKTHLEVRGSSPAVEQAALARYDSIPAATVPSAKVRAALAALTGTFAEPALDALFTTNNCTKKPVAQILIQPPPDAPDLIARVTFNGDGSRIISLNPNLEGDRIEHMMPFLAHETIHCDGNDTLTEEVVATSFDTFLYMQLIAADPSIVDANTPAGRELNIDAMAMINSGRRLPESVGILPSAGFTRALPGTTATFGSFAELVASAYPNIPNGQPLPEAVADAYVQRLAAAAGMQPQPAFNVRYMDELLGRALDPQVLALVIQALELTPA